MIELSLVQKITVWILPVLFAITVHEVAHGWMASKLGDTTAKMLGRLTLNPFKHIDLIGTIILPILLLFIGGFIFGWAKPVPVTWQNLKHPKRDMAFVALAGPMANFIMAFIWTLVIKLGLISIPLLGDAGYLLAYMGQAGIIINVVLMVLNLLPIPPLDGSRILISLLPARLGEGLSRIEPYGFFIILGLLATGLLSHILSPFIRLLINFFTSMLS